MNSHKWSPTVVILGVLVYPAIYMEWWKEAAALAFTVITFMLMEIKQRKGE